MHWIQSPMLLALRRFLYILHQFLRMSLYVVYRKYTCRHWTFVTSSRNCDLSPRSHCRFLRISALGRLVGKLIFTLSLLTNCSLLSLHNYHCIYWLFSLSNLIFIIFTALRRIELSTFQDGIAFHCKRINHITHITRCYTIVVQLRAPWLK